MKTTIVRVRLQDETGDDFPRHQRSFGDRLRMLPLPIGAFLSLSAYLGRETTGYALAAVMAINLPRTKRAR
jgi:hypothetical protein